MLLFFPDVDDDVGSNLNIVVFREILVDSNTVVFVAVVLVDVVITFTVLVAVVSAACVG